MSEEKSRADKASADLWGELDARLGALKQRRGLPCGASGPSWAPYLECGRPTGHTDAHRAVSPRGTVYLWRAEP